MTFLSPQPTWGGLFQEIFRVCWTVSEIDSSCILLLQKNSNALK